MYTRRLYLKLFEISLDVSDYHRPNDLASYIARDVIFFSRDFSRALSRALTGAVWLPREKSLAPLSTKGGFPLPRSLCERKRRTSEIEKATQKLFVLDS